MSCSDASRHLRILNRTFRKRTRIPGGRRTRSKILGFLSRYSVAEMTAPGNHHCHISLIGGDDDFFVAHRTSWLDGGGGAGFGGSDESIGKRKKGVARDGASLQREPGFLCFPDRNPRSIDPRHLAGPDA